MTKKCSCCLRKSQGEMTRIGRPMKNTFKDLIQDFEVKIFFAIFIQVFLKNEILASGWQNLCTLPRSPDDILRIQSKDYKTT